MTQETNAGEAVSLLQELGLQEYEARCFLALTRLPNGTAKKVAEVSEVPRTRVYDAMRVLESRGLVEVQHSSPQQFRAVSTTEAMGTLRQTFDDRIDTLESYVDAIEQHRPERDDDRLQEVWSLSGNEAINSRTLELIDRAQTEIVLLVVDESLLDEAFFDNVQEAADQGLSIILGGETETIRETLGEELSNVRVYEPELEWLTGVWTDHEVAISRILLIDRENLLIGSYYPDAIKSDEQAVYATGLENGVVVLLRRLISTGLQTVD